MPDRKLKRSGSPPEFEVAYYTKELSQPLQREMLQAQMARLSDNGGRHGRSHGDDAAPLPEIGPPPQDRAG